MRVLNLYGGLGGNRKLWPKHLEVTCVEIDNKIANVYKELYPDDTVIVADAHEYLRENFNNFDFIWSSPPCQTHSRMAKFTRHKNKKYPDMKLYEEILFLENFYEGFFLVENVKPYYEPLIPPTQTVGRHIFWSNFTFTAEEIKSPKGFINSTNIEGMNQLKEWLGIFYKKNLYYNGNHCPAQVLRNCVHPRLGKQIIDCLLEKPLHSTN